MGITAIVVARGGSTRLPDKALLPFAGTTLIGHKVRTLRASALINRVVVGSDSTDILTEAAWHGAEIVKRDDYHCDESRCSANEMIADMVGRVDAPDDELIVWAHPTNPLVRADTYDKAIQATQDTRPPYDSLCSVTDVRRHAWVDGKPFNYEPWGERHAFASELKPIQFQDGAIFIQTRKRFLETRYFFGSNPLLFSVSPTEGVDVDTYADLVIARALWEQTHKSSVAANRFGSIGQPIAG